MIEDPSTMARIRQAACSCGELSIACEGEPVRVSVCHCLACQRRTGSAFGAQARFAREQVSGLDGPARTFTRIGDAGSRVTHRFCAQCGSTVWWEIDALPGFVAVALGALADPSLAPTISIYEERRFAWVGIEGDVEHLE